MSVNDRLECYSIGCLKPPAGLLEGHFYCRGHFIVTCYAKLEYCAELLRSRTFTEETFEAIRAFIGECTQQAARLSETAKDLNNFERARLLDILFFASDIGSHMRRSRRKSVAIPVRLHCNTPGHAWQEETVTRSVSLFGALFECRNGSKSGDEFLVEHLQSGRSANARFAWGWHARSGAFVVALEFIDCQNFWELSWDEPADDAVASEAAAALQDVT